MEQLIRVVERVTHNSGYRDAVLAAAPAPTRQDFGPRGVLFGYDFNLGADVRLWPIPAGQKLGFKPT